MIHKERKNQLRALTSVDLNALLVQSAFGAHFGVPHLFSREKKMNRRHSFLLLKLLFLVRNWHCWSRKAFPRQMTPQSREKTAKTAVFATADRHEKLYGRLRLYASAQRRNETGGVLSLFSSLSFDISIKNSLQR